MQAYNKALEQDRHMVENGKLFIWMQLFGLNRDLPDYGVGEWKARMGFLPDGVCLFLPHPDIINQHTDMETEFELHPDDCAYRAIPRNIIRDRQPWTNYDLRGAVDQLNKAGIAPYLSIQGASYHNLYHREWITDHPELHQFNRDGSRIELYPLKRFADGTYYEDFFVEKLCKVLVDYGFEGIQMADNFCPSGVSHNSDFSTEFIGQFLEFTGIIPPEDVMSSMGSDEADAMALRGDWIWKSCREQWILFLRQRWEGFMKKICDAVHAIGKKVIALAVYLTDPFETLYCNGIDLKSFARAGVDYIMPNTLPTSVYFNGRTERFWRIMSTVGLNAAFLDGTEQLCMLGDKDSTEEWDALQHEPNLFQRDIYTLLGQQLVTDAGCRRAADGIMICLGDAIEEGEWDYLRKHFAVAYTHDVESVLTPVVLWSDAALYNTLPAVIETGRWSAHKFVYETANHGAPCGGTVRIEHISSAKGTLFVPNFDLLPEEERQAVAAYSNGPVVATVPAGFDLSIYGIMPDISFTDETADYKMTAFCFGANLSQDIHKQVEDCLMLPDDIAEPEFKIDEVPNWNCPLMDTIAFMKHSKGFITALAKLLYHANDAQIAISCEGAANKSGGYKKCDCPNILLRLKNGTYRLFLYNPERDRYRPIEVNTKKGILDAKVVSFFPILPVKYNHNSSEGLTVYKYEDVTDVVYTSFKTKTTPGGITIVDIVLVE